MKVDILPLDASSWADTLTERARQGASRHHLLVDGTCRRNAVGLFDLDLDDMAVVPLLNPSRTETLSEVGAYCVDLGATLNAIGDVLFQQRFVAPWGAGHGLLIHADMEPRALVRHLRKFLRLQREDDGRTVYFRFWDARISLPYFSGLGGQPDRLAQWMHPACGAVIEDIVFERPEPWPGMQLVPDMGQSLKRTDAIKPILCLPEIALLEDATLRQFDLDTAVGLAAALGDAAPAGLTDGGLGPAFVSTVRTEAKANGVTSRAGIGRWALLSTVLGIRFSYRPWPDLPAADNSAQQSPRKSESEILIGYASVAQSVGAARQRALSRARSIAETGIADTPGIELARAMPDWFGGMTEREQLQTIAHFLSLTQRFENLAQDRLALCAALTGCLGLWWPRDPLRSTLLREICDHDSTNTSIVCALDAIACELGDAKEKLPA